MKREYTSCKQMIILLPLTHILDHFTFGFSSRLNRKVQMAEKYKKTHIWDSSLLYVQKSNTFHYLSN